MVLSKKTKLKEAVDAIKDSLPEDVVVLVSLKKIKNDAAGNPQVQLEVLQSRALGGRTISLLAALNAGDKRFNSSRTTMRIWSMVNEKGFNEVFGEIPGFNFKEAYDKAVSAADDEVVGLMKQIKTVNVGGVKYPAKIVCIETTDIDTLPKSMRDQMNDPDVEDEIKERNILQTGGDNSEHIVDSLGNKIYRRYDLQYGEAKDVMIEGKMLASDQKKPAKQSTEDVLNKVLAG